MITPRLRVDAALYFGRVALTLAVDRDHVVAPRLT